MTLLLVFAFLLTLSTFTLLAVVGLNAKGELRSACFPKRESEGS